MYAALALILVVAFALATIAMPLRFEALYARLCSRLRSKALCAANQAIFHPGGMTEKQSFRLVRIWLLVSAGVFSLLGVLDGTVIRNNPVAIATVAIYGLLALALSCLLLLSVSAFVRLIPGLREYTTLGRCGFRGLWILEPERFPKKFLTRLVEQAGTTEKIEIVDVTGYELFVRGPSPTESLLQTIVSSAPDTPMSLLLLNPFSQEVDPDRQQATIFQTVLAEMGMQSKGFMTKMRKTLQIVEILNSERHPTAQIEVLFYSEKPTMSAVLFDESALVFPWGPQGPKTDLPCLEIARQSDAISFYETYRRTVARLRQSSVAHGITELVAG